MIAGTITVMLERYLLWLVLAVPGGYQLIAYLTGTMSYGQVLHLSGDLATQLLIVTLSVTPLRIVFPRVRALRWLQRRRRALGVATFGYSLLHLLVYLERQGSLAAVGVDALEAAIWTGWIGFCILSLLAATSNDAAVRWLRRRWKRLHRLVYPAAVLVFVHWLLTAYDVTWAMIHCAILLLIQTGRLWRSAPDHGSRSTRWRNEP